VETKQVTEKYIGLSLLFISLLLGAGLRFYGLEKIPGFEHDEALICLGAQSIANGDNLPLTGDKVYEGPLLEYIISISFLIGNENVVSARLVMAILGMIAICLFFGVGYQLGGPLLGGLTAILTSCCPYFLATSRVIYACNLAMIFIPLFFLAVFRYFDQKSHVYAFLAGIFLGLAMNGRFTVLAFCIPLIIGILFYRSGLAILLDLMGVILGLGITILPVLMFNQLNDWPATAILFDRNQSHFLAFDTNTFQLLTARLWAIFKTAQNCFSGDRIWLDFSETQSTGGLCVSLLWIGGIVAALRSKFIQKSKSLGIIVSTVGIGFVIIAVTTKHLLINKIEMRYHPHYLDLIACQMVVLISITVFSLYRSTLRFKLGQIFGSLALIFLVALQSHSIFSVYETYRNEGGPGRWNNQFLRAAESIRTNYSPQQFSLVVDWMFGKGYPQLKFLLSPFDVFPYLGVFTGIYDSSENLVPGQYLTVAHGAESSPPFEMDSQMVVDGGNHNLVIRSVSSPGIWIEGELFTTGARKDQIRMLSNPDSDEQIASGEFVFGSRDTCRFTLNQRRNTLCTDTNLMRLKEKVTPRHRSELKMLARYPCVYNVTGITEKGENVDVHIQLNTRHPFIETEVGNRISSGTLISGNIFIY